MPRRFPPVGLTAGLLLGVSVVLFFQRGTQRSPHIQNTAPIADAGAPAPSTATPATPKSSTSKVEDLTEKKRVLDGEARYAKARRDAAQKHLTQQTAAGNLEMADRLGQELKDWQARLDATRAQVMEVEKELDATESQRHAAANDLVDPNAPVSPGQALDVLVVEDASFNGRYVVRRGGYIIMPQIGRVAVAGRTIPEASAAVERALQSSQLTRATVQIERIPTNDIEIGPTIYFSGEFVSPGNWRFPSAGAPTMSNLFRYFGITDKADLTRVKVMRLNEKQAIVKEIDVLKLMNGDQQTPDLTLEDGDVVVIPALPLPLVPPPPKPHPAQVVPEIQLSPGQTDA